ncbi:hypothetical protein BT96DRAFT_1101476 [Gymnopus androsaceus JB14]|uniref:Uncharacterized protein n=1 Tax=Gymnopus androsaceus JB14 TaxID=1447944 RepID=A0A6A4HNY7_9AGAR|nr:hypothetical protein BT96DRAFT_1101476 [Gymnopus androsaceus JB14]
MLKSSSRMAMSLSNQPLCTLGAIFVTFGCKAQRETYYCTGTGKRKGMLEARMLTKVLWMRRQSTEEMVEEVQRGRED